MEQNRKNESLQSNQNRNTWVKKRLTEAFLQLLEEKDLEEISISELCSRAEVGRTSFYRNYEDKKDILREYLGRLSDSLFRNPEAKLSGSLADLIDVLFTHLEKNRDFYGLLYRRHQTDLIKEELLKECGYNPEQEIHAAYASSFTGFFIYGWIETWLRRGMKDSKEQILDCLPKRQPD